MYKKVKDKKNWHVRVKNFLKSKIFNHERLKKLEKLRILQENIINDYVVYYVITVVFFFWLVKKF